MGQGEGTVRVERMVGKEEKLVEEENEEIRKTESKGNVTAYIDRKKIGD